MPRYKDIGPWLVQLLLLTALNFFTTAPNATGVQPALPVDQRLSWREAKAPGKRCFEVDVPTKGAWWIEMRSTRPAMSPSLMVIGADGGAGPRMLERTYGVMLEVCHPGEYTVCLTSSTPLGDVELASVFLKGGDPLETEVDPDPVICGDVPLETKGGDPLETEVDPDP